MNYRPMMEQHQGLATNAAVWACKRWGGTVKEWLGMANEALADAARTFKPEKGFTFSTHAVGSMRLRMTRMAAKENGYRLKNRSASNNCNKDWVKTVEAMPTFDAAGHRSDRHQAKVKLGSSDTVVQYDPPAPPPPDTTSQDIAAERARALIHEIQEHLNEDCMRVAQYLMAGKSYREIAAEMGKAHWWVGNRVKAIRGLIVKRTKKQSPDRARGELSGQGTAKSE